MNPKGQKPAKSLSQFMVRSCAAAAAALFFAASGLSAQTPFAVPAIDVSAMKAAAVGGPAVEPGASAPAEVKAWTVMVFMNAKNNLGVAYPGIPPGIISEFSAADIAEMQKVGTTPAVNVVVEEGRKGKGSRRMLILKKENESAPGEEVLAEYPDADMGDYKRVIDFIRWAKAAYPAKRYMLVLWNHGQGWMDPARPRAAANKGILFDDETGNYVRTAQLGEIFRRSGYIDILAMNACLMQMAEVAYEAKENTGLILASEETMLAQGFDYGKMLGFMNADPGFTPEGFSEFMMKSFRDLYAAGLDMPGMNMPLNNKPGALSTLRSAAVGELPAYLNAFASAMMRNGETGAAKKAIASAVRFTSLMPQDDKKMLAPYVDLYDFAALAAADAVSPETRKAAEELMGFIKAKLVVRSAGLHTDTENGFDYTRAGGIAINMTMRANPLPAAAAGYSATAYSSLTLSKDSLWDEFVAWCDGVWRAQP